MTEWIVKLLPFLKSSHVEETKLILNELKELKNEYKQEVKEQQKRIVVLERQVIELKEQLHKVEVMELECLEGQVRLVEEIRIVNEKLIFKTKGKHKDDEL